MTLKKSKIEKQLIFLSCIRDMLYDDLPAGRIGHLRYACIDIKSNKRHISFNEFDDYFIIKTIDALDSITASIDSYDTSHVVWIREWLNYLIHADYYATIAIHNYEEDVCSLLYDECDWYPKYTNLINS